MKEVKDFEKLNRVIVPKGLIIAVGGNEDKEHDLFVLRKIVGLIKKRSVPRLVEKPAHFPDCPLMIWRSIQRVLSL